MSMIKRNLGSFIAARKDGSRAVEVMLKVLTHNIMLIAATLLELFYRASGDPFLSDRRIDRGIRHDRLGVARFTGDGAQLLRVRSGI